MNFSQTLKKLMSERSYTNYRLAKEIGCSQTTVGNWLKGINVPQGLMCHRIADVFGVSVEFLRGETDDRGETKKAPTENGERKNDKLSMLVDLFERLPPEEQNAVIFDLLQKAQAQLDQDSRQ